MFGWRHITQMAGMLGFRADENGDYSIPVIAGEWNVFPNQPPYSVEARYITVAGGQTVTDQDFVLTDNQPIFSVNLNQDYVYTDFWDPYSTISLYVDDVIIDTKITDENGWLVSFNVDVQPHSTVMVRDSDGTEKILEDVSAIGHDVTFDMEANTLSGTADEGSELQVWAHDSDCVDTDNEFVYATSVGGAWTAEFDGACTVQTGSWGYAQIYDVDGDYTEIYWSIPDPYISLILNTWASNPGQSQVNGLEWKAGLESKANR